MKDQQVGHRDRREFLKGLTAVRREPAGRSLTRRGFLGELSVGAAAGILGLRPGLVAADPAPETARIRLVRQPGVCLAPEYVAEELLRAEGFTDVRYVAYPGYARSLDGLASGEITMTINFAGSLLMRVDAGDPITLLAGIHVGCYELFGTVRVRTVRDLKGKTVGVTELGSGRHVFLAAMMAYVGLDPRGDVNLVVRPPAESMRLLADGKIDAYMGFPPDPQELRARKVGHVVLNSTTDRPWSQYFCCMIGANRDFVRAHPVATKRAVRAILKATNVCAIEPERIARFLVDKDYTTQYDFALQTLKEVPYNRWREYDPEDAVRFYALRLHEVGMIKSSPQKLIAQGTDWGFLNELKKELKG